MAQAKHLEEFLEAVRGVHVTSGGCVGVLRVELIIDAFNRIAL